MVANVISPRRGTIFPPERQRRREALRAYAEHQARADGRPLQTWVRETWDLKDYEAKDLIRGNASENVWERILRQRQNPHGGMGIGLIILEAIVGETLDEHFTKQGEFVANERAAWTAEESRIAALEAGNRERRSFARGTPRKGALPNGRADSPSRVGASGVGGKGTDATDVATSDGVRR